MSLLARSSCDTLGVQRLHEAGGYIHTTTARASNRSGDISRTLQQEGIKATGRGITKFLAKCIESGSVARKPGSGRPSKCNGPCNGMERTVELGSESNMHDPA